MVGTIGLLEDSFSNGGACAWLAFTDTECAPELDKFHVFGIDGTLPQDVSFQLAMLYDRNICIATTMLPWGSCHPYMKLDEIFASFPSVEYPSEFALTTINILQAWVSGKSFNNVFLFFSPINQPRPANYRGFRWHWPSKLEHTWFRKFFRSLPQHWAMLHSNLHSKLVNACSNHHKEAVNRDANIATCIGDLQQFFPAVTLTPLPLPLSLQPFRLDCFDELILN